MAMEDVGVLVHMLRHYCCDGGASPFDPSESKLAEATAAYQEMRIPRTRRILGSSHQLGKTQQRRADSKLYNLWREWNIKWECLMYAPASSQQSPHACLCTTYLWISRMRA